MLCIVYLKSLFVHETIFISEIYIVMVSLLNIFHPATHLVPFLIFQISVILKYNYNFEIYHDLLTIISSFYYYYFYT